MVLLFSIIAAYSNFTPHQLTMLFSSDSLFFPSLYNDLANDGGNIRDWFLASSFTIFPDYTIYFVINKIFNVNFLAAEFIYAFIQVILLVMLLTYIFKKTVPENLKKYSWLIPLFFSMFFIESFYFSKDILITTLLCNYSYHTGAFFSAILTFAILLSSFPNWVKYVFIYLIALLSMFSDLLFLITTVVPITILLLSTMTRKKIKFNLIVIICLIIGSYSGLKVFNYLREHHYTHFSESINIFDLSRIKPALIIFKNQMLDYFTCHGFRMYHFIFTFLAIPVTFFLLLFKRKNYSEKQIFFMTFFFVFSCCVLAAPIVNGIYIGYDNLRYSISTFYFSIIVLGITLAFLFENKIKSIKVKTLILFILPTIFLLMIATRFSFRGLKDYFVYYPEKVSEIDNVCKKYGLTHGISEYWVGKWVTMFSKNNVKIRTVYSTLCANPMGSNGAWCCNEDFDFVVADKLDSEAIKTRLKIKDTVQTESYTILIVDKFHFPPGEALPSTK